MTGSDLILFLCMSVLPARMPVHVGAVPTEASRGHRILYSGSYWDKEVSVQSHLIKLGRARGPKKLVFANLE